MGTIKFSDETTSLCAKSIHSSIILSWNPNLSEEIRPWMDCQEMSLWARIRESGKCHHRSWNWLNEDYLELVITTWVTTQSHTIIKWSTINYVLAIWIVSENTYFSLRIEDFFYLLLICLMYPIVFMYNKKFLRNSGEEEVDIDKSQQGNTF